ncbi:Fe-S cluster assembly protein SufD [Candidatus Coxiella mudrowiae]|uniref:FeS assembly protein SufD n=1 Tax=Candidatus Coxiella mudrowiae TaxID=2054173 RepID=A0ABM5UV68_9COXI|nr:Fe-S cluster assembly protein SufD [Candidatus Coxiella mudrowiae]AKQ33782.1 FeS assembly protein SufD [Candidatus Coxiella mudrowiae]
MRMLSEGWSEARLKRLQNQNRNSLQAWQHEQLKTFLLMGFPNCKIENWKYTDITSIASQTFSFGEITDCDITRFIMEDTHRIVFINGHFAPTLSNLMQLPAEIQLMSLKAALKENQKEIIGEMRSYETPFSLLNDSLFQDGMFLHVPKNYQLEKPIHLLYLMKPNFPFSMTQTRHLIFIEENASVTLLEEYQGVYPTTYFNNIVTQINVGASANLVFYKLQGENNNSFHIANTQICQARNSQVISCHVSLGGALAREDLNYALQGHNASCQLLGFYHLKGGRHIDNHTRIDHGVSGCVSQQIYKGIISDKSRAVFNGKIFVHSEAKKTIAHQINKNLVFSNEAEVNTKPELEIYNDDVNCTHGATVGQLNDEALFYLCSRGIDRSAAQHLLACAFASEIIEKIPHKFIAERIHQRIIKCLGLLNSLGDCHN